MDRHAFKERLKLYKQAKEQNPLLKYYEFRKYSNGTDFVGEPDKGTPKSKPVPEMDHRWDNPERYIDRMPFDSPYEDPRWFADPKPRFEFRKGSSIPSRYTPKSTMRFMHGSAKGMGYIGTAIELAQGLFPTEEQEVYENLRLKMSNTNKQLLSKKKNIYQDGTDGVTFKAQPHSERPITGYDPTTGKFTVGYNPGAGYVKSVLSTEDMPVIGDAMSLYDTGNAIINKDWLTAGLTAAAMLPIVPKNINKLIKESDWNNAINRELEKIFQKDVRKRGDLIDKKHGTTLINYYKQLADKYTNNYEQMPKAKLVDGNELKGRARMTITDDAQKRFKETGEKPSWGDYVMEVRDDIDVDPEIAQHEIAHFNQYMNNDGPDLNKLPYGTGTEDMVYINPLDQLHSKYFRNIGELSAYLLTIINEMKRKGISINKKNYNKFVNSLDNTDSKKKAVKQFKTNNAAYNFTKMIPLTGVVGALFMINSNKEDKSN